MYGYVTPKCRPLEIVRNIDEKAREEIDRPVVKVPYESLVEVAKLTG